MDDFITVFNFIIIIIAAAVIIVFNGYYNYGDDVEFILKVHYFNY
jgi:hypothetical protein